MFNQPHRPFDDDYPSDYVPGMENDNEFNQIGSPILGSRKQSFSSSVLSDVMKGPSFPNTSELINHVATCSNYLCPYEQCQELKLQCFHYSLCDRRDCKICSQLSEILMEHKRSCNPSQCFFILCRNTLLPKMNDMAPPRNNPNGGGSSKSRHNNHSSSSHHNSHSKQNQHHQQQQQAMLQAQHSPLSMMNNNNIQPSISPQININVKTENKKYSSINNNNNNNNNSSPSSLIMIQPSTTSPSNNNITTPSSLMLNSLTISTPANSNNNNSNIPISIQPNNNNNNNNNSNIPISSPTQTIIVKQQQQQPPPPSSSSSSSQQPIIINNNNNNNIKTIGNGGGILWSTMLVQPDPTNKGKLCKHTPRKMLKGQTQQPPIYVQWVHCCLCNKLRKLPGHMEIARLKEFKCNMNIWDPPYADCIVPEEEDKENTTIDLQGNYLEYEQEKEAFMEKLKQFHRESGSGVVLRTPTLGRKEVDLYRLFREVSSYGGACSVVSKEGTWARIYRGMDNFSPTETSASFRLKKMYNKYLLSFEKFVFNFDDTLPSSSTTTTTTTTTPTTTSNPAGNMIDNNNNNTSKQWGNNGNTKYTYFPAASDNNNNKTIIMSNIKNNSNIWICSDCGTRNTTNQFCSNCQTTRKKRKTSNESKYNNEMKPPPSHLYQTPNTTTTTTTSSSTFTATVSLSQQQQQSSSTFMNPLLQPPSIPEPQMTQSSSSSSLTSLPSSSTTTATDNNPNNNGNNNQLPRKESIGILFTRKESYYTLPADGSTPLLNTNNTPPSQSISPTSSFINSNTFTAIRRDSFNLPELTLGPSAATDMDMYLRNTDLHNEH